MTEGALACEIEVVTEHLLHDTVIHLHQPVGYFRRQNCDGSDFIVGGDCFNRQHIRALIDQTTVQLWRRLAFEQHMAAARSAPRPRDVWDEIVHRDLGGQEERAWLFKAVYARCSDLNCQAVAGAFADSDTHNICSPRRVVHLEGRWPGSADFDRTFGG